MTNYYNEIKERWLPSMEWTAPGIDTATADICLLIGEVERLRKIEDAGHSWMSSWDKRGEPDHHDELMILALEESPRPDREA